MKRRILTTAGRAITLPLALLPLAVIPPAFANDDINDDTGQTEDEVEQEIWSQAATSKEVTAAYDNLMNLIATSDGLRDDLLRLQAQAKAARNTPGKADDRRIAKEIKDVRSRLKLSLSVERAAKNRWDDIIDTSLSKAEAQHFVSQPTSSAGGPKGDGSYTGKSSHRNPFGDVQVTITVTGGAISDCSASYPTASSSGAINNGAVPILCAEAIASQSAAIASVGGASYTSPAFKESLADAIARAGL